MSLPERIGGPEKKPGLVVAIGLKKPGLPSRIGGMDEEPDEGASMGDPMDNEKAKDEATKEIMSAISDRSDLRLKAGLEAFFLACEAEPHKENDEGLGEEE